MFDRTHMKKIAVNHIRLRGLFGPDEDETTSVRPTTTQKATTPAQPEIVTQPTRQTNSIIATSSSSSKSSATPTREATTTSQSTAEKTSSSPTTSSTQATSTTSSSKSSTSSSQTSTHSTSSSSSSSISSATPSTQVLTRSLSASNAVASASGTTLDSAASSTSTATPSSGISTLGIIGITGAAIVGAAVLMAIIMFFVRRANKKDDGFDSDEFKDQSVVLKDESAPSYGSYGGTSYDRSGPRPPTMFERHNQNMVTYADRPSWGYPQNNTYGQMNNYGEPNPFSDYAAQPPQMSYGPGMYAPSPVASPLPTAAPFLARGPSMHTQSPAPGPSPAPYVSPYENNMATSPHNVGRSLSNASSQVLSRGNSMTQQQQHSSSPHDAEGDYADLNRQSVTPFQAAQYEAISKQLNIPMPVHLPRVSESPEPENQVQGIAIGGKHDSGSPFNDPATAVSMTGPDTSEQVYTPARPSSEFHHDGAQVLDLPAEPSPRVTSTPPILPEIERSQHVFTPTESTFPTSSPRKASFDAPAAPAPVQIAPSATARKDSFPPLSPVPSSPQRATVVNGDANSLHEGRETPVQIEYVAAPPKAVVATSSPPVAPQSAAGPQRPVSAYDDDDAYGGI